MGAEILAISADDLVSHQGFSIRLGGIPFPMLSDQERKVIQLYGVAKEEGHGIRRSVFVLDREGKIVFVNREFGANNFRHYEEIYEALEIS